MILQVLLASLILGLSQGTPRRLDDYENAGYGYGVKHPAGNSRVLVRTGSGYGSGNSFYNRGHNQPYLNSYAGEPSYQPRGYGSNFNGYDNPKPYNGQRVPVYEEHFRHPQPAPRYSHNIYDRSGYMAQPDKYKISQSAVESPFYDKTEDSGYYGRPAIQQEQVAIDDVSPSYPPRDYIVQSPLDSRSDGNNRFGKTHARPAYPVQDQYPIVQQVTSEDPSYDSNKYNSPDVPILTQRPVDNKFDAPIEQQTLVDVKPPSDFKPYPNQETLSYEPEVQQIEEDAVIAQYPVDDPKPLTVKAVNNIPPSYSPKINVPVVQQQAVEEDILLKDYPSSTLTQKPIDAISQLTIDSKPPLQQHYPFPSTKQILKKSEAPVVQQEYTDDFRNPIKKASQIYDSNSKIPGNIAVPVVQATFDDHPSQAVYDSSIEPSFSDFDDHPNGQSIIEKPEYQFVPVGPPYERISHSTEIVHPPPRQQIVLPGKQAKPSYFPQTSKVIPSSKTIKSIPKVLVQSQEDISPLIIDSPPRSIKRPVTSYSYIRPISPPVKNFYAVPRTIRYPHSGPYSIRKPNPFSHSVKRPNPVPPSVKYPHTVNYPSVKYSAPPPVKIPYQVRPSIRYSTPSVKLPTPVAPAVKLPPPVAPAIKFPPPIAPAVKLPPPVAPAVKLPPPVAPAVKLPPPVAPAIKLPPPVAPAVKLPPPVAPAIKLPPPVAQAVKLPPPVAPAVKLPPPVIPAVKVPNPISYSVKQPKPIPSSIKYPSAVSHSVKSSNPFVKYPPPIGILHRKVPVAMYPSQVKLGKSSHVPPSVKGHPVPSTIKGSHSPLSVKGPQSIKSNVPHSIKSSYDPHVKSSHPPPPFLKEADVSPHISHPSHVNVPLNEYSPNYGSHSSYPESSGVSVIDPILSHGGQDFIGKDESPIQNHPPISHSIRLPVPNSPLNSKPLSPEIHSDEISDLGSLSPLTKPKSVSHAVILPNLTPNPHVTTVPNLFASVPQGTPSSYVEFDDSPLNKPPPVSHAYRLPLPDSRPAHSPENAAIVSGDISPPDLVPPEPKHHSPVSHSVRLSIPANKPARSINFPKQGYNDIDLSSDKDDESAARNQDFPAFPVRSAFTQEDPVADKVSELTRSYSPRINREPEDESPSTNEAKRQIDRLNKEIGASFGDRLSRRSPFSRIH